ncbi:hypothetical protein FJZ33_02975 [Candidatus Poribacteria bacterium]|nr:hypothetical protein [Candidatus Poribacteria bacterium]
METMTPEIKNKEYNEQFQEADRLNKKYLSEYLPEELLGQFKPLIAKDGKIVGSSASGEIELRYVLDIDNHIRTQIVICRNGNNIEDIVSERYYVNLTKDYLMMSQNSEDLHEDKVSIFKDFNELYNDLKSGASAADLRKKHAKKIVESGWDEVYNDLIAQRQSPTITS